MIKISIIGLGYVGLPLCLNISKKYETIGFDVNKERVSALNNFEDKNNEFKKKDFKNRKIFFTNKISEISKCNLYIICVPTPITKKKIPDLNPIKKSFISLSKVLKKNDIIILESTVYPGITKYYTEFLENKTKLKNNKDFYVCYSPERINPGDKENNLTKINKILAVETKNKKILSNIKKVYNNFCKKLIFTTLIKEAETAKTIENIQRDLNIAIFNELLMICEKLKINFTEVIRLANTKWNFIKFQPGLVGGHCLPVDPFYLSYVAKKKNFKAITTLAGRKTNDNMKYYVLNKFSKFLKENKIKNKNIKILIVGLSYKYGVADMRNSINYEIFRLLKKKFKNTYSFDPFVRNYNFNTNFFRKNISSFNAVIFLSKGKIFQKIYNNIKSKKPKIILDPFYYYSK
jgi:UDP-N-acetyl-D-glucosamine/UDP-N-acetyl-D-galactosamine dehydrogenase